MGELKSHELAPEEAARTEALLKIREFFGDRTKRGDVYLEDLYMGSGEWATRISAAKERVPSGLRNQASRFHIRVAMSNAEEGGPQVPPELLAYKAEVDKIFEDFGAFSEALSDDDIWRKALTNYNAAFQNSPKESYKVADLFLGEALKQRAAQRVVELGMERFRTSEDIVAELQGVRAVMEHYKEVSIEPDILKELVEYAILHHEADRYSGNFLTLKTLGELRKKYRLPESEVIYEYIRPLAREEIEGSIHRHERRKELRALADQYLGLGFLREKEDQDLLDILRDKTPYERERDQECARIDAAVAPLEFSKYGIEQGKSVSIEEVARFLSDHKKALSEGLRRNSYWHLRRNMFWTPPSMSGSRFIRAGFEKARASKWYNIGQEGETERELVFKFKMKDEDTYRRTSDDEWHQGGVGTYLSKDDFVLDDITVQTHVPFEKRREVSVDGLEGSAVGSTMVQADKIIEMVREIMEPEVDVSRAITEFRKAARRMKIRQDEVQKMVYAMGQFATYYKRPPLTDSDCYGEVGACLTRPSRFAIFARRKFGLDVDTPHYGDGISFYHKVNERSGVIIDWTARQYSRLRDKPFPFVYGQDELDKIGFGKLRSIRKEVQEELSRNPELRESARRLRQELESGRFYDDVYDE